MIFSLFVQIILAIYLLRLLTIHIFTPLKQKSVEEYDMKTNESQVFSYTAPWLIYALGFSCREDFNYRIGLGSFNEETDNMVL